MKASKYNIYYTDNELYYIYNQLTGFLAEVEKRLYDSISENKNFDDFSEEESQYFINSGIICDDDLQEEMLILKMNKERRFGNHHARVTIMPTLDCNFRCWYCYEEHFHSKMDDATVNATINFCKRLIDSHNLKLFSLDWFGGEPLLYFDEVMYPIAKEIMAYCEEKNVAFTNGITTNGYLIDEERISKFKEIRLNSFQITLDGSEKYHNKTRFSPTDKMTYTTIVKNIERLVRNIEPISMTVRINYTPTNLPTIDAISESFSPDVRNKLDIMPQLVWQFKDNINPVDDVIHDKLKVFSNAGYKAERVYLRPSECIGCYTENMLQFVVNYDASIFKCTARNFKDSKYSIGKLDENGNLIANANYYNYYTQSALENAECIKCDYLPSCHGTCIQKKIENGLPKCSMDLLKKSIINQLRLVIEKSRKNLP